MNSKEKIVLEEVCNVMCNTQKEFTSFKKEVSDKVEHIEKKHVPIKLESDILQVVQQSITESIKTVLTGYNSPLNTLVTQVVNSHSGSLRSIINDSFSEVISTKEFKQSIVSAFSHKIARSIISNNEGLFDKVSNELKQDATFRAKITLAIGNVVEECLKNE